MANPMDIYNFVDQAGQRGRQQYVGRQINMLAGQALEAAPAERDAIVAQAAKLDPDAAFGLQKQLNADTDRRQIQLYNMARGLKQAFAQNPLAAKALYERQFAPGLQRMGFDVSPTFNDQEVMPVVEQVLAAYGAGGAEQVQSTQILSNGNIGIVTRAGQVVDTGQAAAPTTQLVNEPGQVPYLVTTGRGNVGQTTAIGGNGGVAPAPSNAPRNLYVSGTGVPMSVDGTADTGGPTTISFTGATPEQNAAVGRVVDAMRAAGAGDDEIGTYVAGQEARFNRPAPAAVASPQPMRNPTQAEVARATQDAKNASDLDAYTRMTGLAAEREAATTTAREQAEQQVQKQGALPQVVAQADETLSLLDRVLAHPGRAGATGFSAANPLNRIPGTDAYDFNVLLDQIKGQAFLQAFQSLRGGGAITEREGQAATNAIARLNAAQSESEFETAVRDLRRIVAGGRDRAVSSASRPAPAASAPNASAAAAVPRAKNPRTGEVIEFRDGKWGPAR